MKNFFLIIVSLSANVASAIGYKVNSHTDIGRCQAVLMNALSHVIKDKQPKKQYATGFGQREEDLPGQVEMAGLSQLILLLEASGYDSKDVKSADNLLKHIVSAPYEGIYNNLSREIKRLSEDSLEIYWYVF